jgi:hypothetical protein
MYNLSLHLFALTLNILLYISSINTVINIKNLSHHIPKINLSLEIVGI